MKRKKFGASSGLQIVICNHAASNGNVIDLAQKGTRSQRGTTRLSGSTSTLEHIKRLSAPYGTVIDIRDGVGYVRMP